MIKLALLLFAVGLIGGDVAVIRKMRRLWPSNEVGQFAGLTKALLALHVVALALVALSMATGTTWPFTLGALVVAVSLVMSLVDATRRARRHAQTTPRPRSSSGRR